MVLKFLLVVVVVVIVIIVVFVVVIVVVIVVVFGCAAGAALSSILVVIIVVAINVVVVDLFVWTMWPFCCHFYRRHRCYRRQRQSSLTSLFFAYVSSSLVCHYCTLGRYQMISMVLVSYGLKMLMLYALRYSL